MKSICLIMLAFILTTTATLAAEAGKSGISGVSQGRFDKQGQNTLTINGKNFVTQCGAWGGDGSYLVIPLLANNNRMSIICRTKGAKPQKGSFEANIEITDLNTVNVISKFKGTLIINSFNKGRIKGILKGNDSNGNSINALINSTEEEEPTEGG